jgi:PAS domain S-box-containing protein
MRGESTFTRFQNPPDKALLEMFIEHTPAAVAMFDREMRYLAVTQRFADDFGMSIPSVIGKCHYDIFPEIPDRWKEIHRRCLAGSTEKSEGDEFPRPDGTVDYLKWEVRPWRTVDGEIGGLIIFSVLFTRSKLLEAKAGNDKKDFLRGISHELLRLENIDHTISQIAAMVGGAFDVQSCMFSPIDGANGLCALNSCWNAPGTCRIEGGVSIADFITNEQVERVERGETTIVCDTEADHRVVDKISAFTEIKSFIMIPICQDGRLAFLGAVFDTKPRKWLFDEVSLLQEVTEFAAIRIERARIDQALAHTQAKYHSLFNSIDEGFCIIEMIFDATYTPVDYRFIEMNPAFYRHSGLTEAKGRTISSFFANHDKSWLEIYGEIGATGEAVRFQKLSTRLDRWYDIYAWRFGAASDHQVAILFNDITEFKTALKDLEQAKIVAENANQQKSAFLANMSHEIRTPLGVVLGFSELLAEQNINAATRAKYVSTIKHNGELLAKVIDDVLDLSKVESGNLSIEVSEFAIRQLFSDIQQSLKLRAQQKGITLSFVSEGDIPDIVSSDPLRLRQILLNIVGNAVKFTDKGSVEVKLLYSPLADGSSELACLVTDTGVGIAKENISKLFIPFSQVDASAVRRFGGTGLGLALSRRLAKLLGGDITLMKTELGKGSTFEVKINAGRANVGVAVPAIDEPRVTTSNLLLDNINIFLVEDSPDVQFLVSEFLETEGAIVSTASNGKEALEGWNRHPYDVILMDLQMPFMDGYQATAKLRSLGCTTPVIAVTAHAMLEDRRLISVSGFNDHITKPIDRGRLYEAILRATS